MHTVFPKPQSRNSGQSFKKRIKAALPQFSAKITNLAYSIRSPKKYHQRHQQIVLNSSWQVSYTSADLNSDHYGYQAIAFINHVSREVHIASAGTELQDLYDLWDDARLCANYVPNKLASAQSFLDNLLAKHPIIKNYNFSTSGHSLGAIVSDLTGAEILSRGLKFNYSTTFENPGSALVLKRAIQNKLFSGQKVWTVDQLAQQCIVYNASPNFINHLKYQLAEEINLVLLPKKEQIKDKPRTWYSSLYKTISSGFKRCINWLGINKIENTLSDHKLANFLQLEQAVSIPVEGASWHSNELQKLVLKLDKDDPLLERLMMGPSTGSDIMLFFDDPVHQEDPLVKEYSFMEQRREYSFEDLRQAYWAVKPLLQDQPYVRLMTISADSNEIDEGFYEESPLGDPIVTNISLLDDEYQDEGFYDDKTNYERCKVVTQGLTQSVAASEFGPKRADYPAPLQPVRLPESDVLINLPNRAC